jgi:hypothetical protein
MASQPNQLHETQGRPDICKGSTPAHAMARVSLRRAEERGLGNMSDLNDSRFSLETVSLGYRRTRDYLWSGAK